MICYLLISRAQRCDDRISNMCCTKCIHVELRACCCRRIGTMVCGGRFFFEFYGILARCLRQINWESLKGDAANWRGGWGGVFRRGGRRHFDLCGILRAWRAGYEDQRCGHHTIILCHRSRSILSSIHTHTSLQNLIH